MSIVGIDLGTTNSLISVFRNGKSELIANAYGETLTPSVVSVLDSGEIIVGRAAKERLYTHPERTAAAFKRFMGTKKQYGLGSQTFTPTELSSLVLKSLKADAEAELGEPVTEAIISVPAYFNDQQRRATKQAGELAGLKVERLISEPTAAALAYGLHESRDELQFLVFDLGGGTFDVSVVEMFDDILEVKAVAGNNFLGGEDFDNAITNWFIDSQEWTGEIDPRIRSMIKEKAEIAKRELSSNEIAVMRVVIAGEAFEATLTRSRLEDLSEPILTQIRQPVMRALHDAKIRPDDLSHVILVGGTSRMPLIRNYAKRLFERDPMSEINPDEAVGLGAGVAAALKERNRDLGERLMTDVCPYSLGTEVAHVTNSQTLVGNIFDPIIERNTPIPYSRVKSYTTLRDNQKEIRSMIFQGENRQADQNLKLGEIVIKIPPKPAGQSEIKVRYTYDINGILEVEVTSVDTGETKREVIINSENVLTQEEVNETLTRMKLLKIHPREKSVNRLLLERANRLYEEALGVTRRIISEQTIVFEAILDEQDPLQIEEAAAGFAAFLNNIERNI